MQVQKQQEEKEPEKYREEHPIQTPLTLQTIQATEVAEASAREVQNLLHHVKKEVREDRVKLR